MLRMGSAGLSSAFLCCCPKAQVGIILLLLRSGCWVTFVVGKGGSDVNKYVRNCCGKPFLFQSGLQCAGQWNVLKILNVQINTGKVLWHPPEPSSVDPLVLQLLHLHFPMAVIHVKWWSSPGDEWHALGSV